MMRIIRSGAVLVLGLGVALGQNAVPARPTGPVRISGGVIAGNILTKVNPVYAPEAKEKGIQGAVVLHAVLAKDGTVSSLEVISGNEVLAQAAIDAVKQWTYKPYLLNGEPVEVNTTITVMFSFAQ